MSSTKSANTTLQEKLKDGQHTVISITFLFHYTGEQDVTIWTSPSLIKPGQESSVGWFGADAHVGGNLEGRKGGPPCEPACAAFYLCISWATFYFFFWILLKMGQKKKEKKAKWQWQRLKKNIRNEEFGRGRPSQRAASAVPWEGQPCIKELIFLLLFQETLKPKCNACRPAPSLHQTPPVLQALQLRMSQARHRDLGGRGGTEGNSSSLTLQRGNTWIEHQGWQRIPMCQ